MESHSISLFGDWLIALSIMSSFIHDVADVRLSFFIKAGYIAIVCTPHLCIHCSGDGRLSGFHLLAAVTTAAVNEGVHLTTASLTIDIQHLSLASLLAS